MNPPKTPSARLRQAGFNLIELMVVLLVVAILAAVAYPAYTNYLTRSRRAAAEACLSNYATYMERYYTTYMRYDQAGSGGKANTLPTLDCATSQNTGAYYSYKFDQTPTQSTYTIDAVPAGVQLSNDTECGTLTLDQTGQRGITGTGTVSECW